MSEDTSLTAAIREAAGVSLTKEVKEVAGHRSSFIEEMLGGADDAISRGSHKVLAQLRIVVMAVLALLFVSPPSQVHDKQRATPVVPPKRVALVIGNSAYRHTPRLDNPKNDAADMGAALKMLGFQVIEGFDLDKAAFDAKVQEFGLALGGADVGIFFYAGHGMQVSGQNFLVPIDATPTAVVTLGQEMVRLDVIHAIMEKRAKTNLLFFDACRDNPLVRNLARSTDGQSPQIGRGLAAVESGAGTLISFSTQPGNVALDGKGRNSPYSGALVKHLAASGEDLNAILITVRNDVMRQTDRKQVPWEHSALTRRFYFRDANSSSAVQASQMSEAANAWSAISDTATVAVLDAFIARYGDTFFAELARARREELRQTTAPLPVAGFDAEAAPPANGNAD